MASNWSKPLKIDATINKALVAQSIAAETPVGDHSHDDTERTYTGKNAAGNRVRRNYGGEARGGWPRQGGRLKRYIGHIPNWHLKDKGRACYINIFLPYARILEFGGEVSGVSFDQFKMHWADGSPVYRTARKGYKIKGQGYIVRGVQRFASHGGNAINVQWAKGTDTA